MILRLTFHKVFPANEHEPRIIRRCHDLDRIGLFIDALTLAEHFVRQNVAYLEKNVLSDFLLDPALVLVFWPVVEIGDADFALHSELTAQEQVDVRQLLVFANQAFTAVQDAVLGCKQQVFKSRIFP